MALSLPSAVLVPASANPLQADPRLPYPRSTTLLVFRMLLHPSLLIMSTRAWTHLILVTQQDGNADNSQHFSGEELK